MQKRAIGKVIIVLTAIMLFVLSGCGTKPTAPQQSSTPQEKKVIRLTIGTVFNPATAIQAKVLDEFFAAEVSKRVEEKTNYRIEWNKVYSGTVMKPGEEMDAVKNKTVDVGFISLPYEVAKLPMQNFTYAVPFGPNDPTAEAKIMKQVIKDVPELTSVLEKDYNQKVMGFMVTQNYGLVTKFPIEKLSDLKGHKIGAVGPNLHWLQGSGAVPVQSAAGEIYTSLQTGVYDGFMFAIDSFLNLKIYEVAKNFNVVDLGSMFGAVITINLDSLNALPKEVQDIVLQVGDEYSDVLAKESKSLYESQLTKWQENGGKIVQVSAEEKEKWAKGMPNTPNAKAKELDVKGLPGSKLMKRYFEVVKENGYSLPSQYVIQ